MEKLLKPLLDVKRIREDGRECEMRGARRRLEEAAAACEDACRERQARDAARAEQERRMYEEVFARPVRVRDLEDLRGEVALLREAALSDAEMVERAREHREKRRGELDDAAAAWRLAAQAREKFSGLLQAARADTARELERLADLEMEEFTVRRPDEEAFAGEAGPRAEEAAA